MLLEAVFVLALVGVVFYGAMRVLTRNQHRPLPGVGDGKWRATHYDVKGATRVVLQKTSPGGANLLDEHLIATINLDDPDPECALCHVAHTARERAVRVAVSNSFGFGGSNTCLVLRAA